MTIFNLRAHFWSQDLKTSVLAAKILKWEDDIKIEISSLWNCGGPETPAQLCNGVNPLTEQGCPPPSSAWGGSVALLYEPGPTSVSICDSMTDN